MRPALTVLSILLAIMLIAGSSIAADPARPSSSGSSLEAKFWVAIGDYFRAPDQEISIVRAQRIPNDEFAAIFYLSQRAGVTVQAVIDLRKAGRSYAEITDLFQLSPAIFYVPIKTDPGPPFGQAYGHFKKHPKSEWKKIQLADDDIINLVNLRFISNQCKVSPEDVINLRTTSKTYVQVLDETVKFAAEAKRKAGAPKALNFADKNKGPKPK
jgi:hypothetical protein